MEIRRISMIKAHHVIVIAARYHALPSWFTKHSSPKLVNSCVLYLTAVKPLDDLNFKNPYEREN